MVEHPLRHCQPEPDTGNTQPLSLASLVCSGLPGGPTGAGFTLWVSSKAVQEVFTLFYHWPKDCGEWCSPSGAFNPVNCPGASSSSESYWSGGLFACGITNLGGPVIIYTNDRLFGMVVGTDLNSLFNWWENARTPG